MKKIISFAILTIAVLWLIGCCKSLTDKGGDIGKGDIEYVVTYRVHYSSTATENVTYKFFGPEGLSLALRSWHGTNSIVAYNEVNPLQIRIIMSSTAPLQILSYSKTFKNVDKNDN